MNYSKALLLSVMVITAAACKKSGEQAPGGKEPEPDKNTASTTGISQFDRNVNIFSTNTALLSNNAMQGFNFDSDGSIWYTQSTESSTKHQLNLVRAMPNKNTSILKAETDFMKLQYFGHGTNTAIEEQGADRYLWLGAYGTCNSAGEYWGEKVIGRVKYVKGKTVKTNECDEYYYIGDYHDMHAAIDADHDLLAINYADDANSLFRCFVVYKLSEAKKAGMSNRTITCTDGFEKNNPASTTTKNVTVYCKDLSTLTPVARLKFRKTGYGPASSTYYDWQGYDVYKDRIYYTEGQSNYNLVGSFFTDDVSQSFVTIFDFNGNVVEERTKVAFISNRQTLSDIGVTRLGAMEAEGIKVYKDKLYLGFTARGITQEDTKHYQNIFVFNKGGK